MIDIQHDHEPVIVVSRRRHRQGENLIPELAVTANRVC